MKCAPADLYFLFQLPALTFAKIQTIEPFLKQQIRFANELHQTLSNYPNIKHQYLDFYYLLNKSLSIMDEDVIYDLLNHYSWQGKIIAAFLCYFSPKKIYEPSLIQALSQTPAINQWLIQLALHAIDPIHAVDNISAHTIQLFESFKAKIIPTTDIKNVRKIPYKNLKAEEQRHKHLLAQIYHSDGTHAAYQFMQQSNFYKLFFKYQ